MHAQRMNARFSGTTGVRPRVFVSSVMDGYKEYRGAARQGIELAGCYPVLAEDFPAQGISPRNACIDGVQSADALVLLLGERYGWIGPSGRSATEEEYEEARQQQLPILVFVEAEDVLREPRQREFVRRIEDYVGGHFRKSFQEANDLRRFVREAIEAADLGGMPSSLAGAESRIRASLNRRAENTQDGVWMQICWATERNEEVVDPVRLDDSAFKRSVQELAHVGDPPLFSYEQGKKVETTLSRLRVIQGDLQTSMPSEHATVLTIHSDGTLAILQNVTGPAQRDLNRRMVSMYRLDPDVVHDRLDRSWSFAAAWWNELDRPRRHHPLLYGVALYDVGARSFARVADYTPGGGLALPPECPKNPLSVFDRPRRVSRTVLDSPGSEVTRIIKMMELRFREWARERW